MNLKKPSMEFHVSRSARDFYRFDQMLFSLTGNVIFADFHAARLFAQKMNEGRDLILYPERAVKAGDINAMGLIDEILHYIVTLYREQKNPRVMGQAMEWVTRSVGREEIDALLVRFVDQFPPVSVYKNEISPGDYLKGETAGVSNRELALEELIMLWLANANQAFSPFLELFDDETLEKRTPYTQVVSSLKEFFHTQPPFGPHRESLLDMLCRPAMEAPHSLSAQLDYIRSNWSQLLGEYLYRLLSSLDFIKEEQKLTFLGPGPSRVYEYGGLELEAERFSQDLDWMPRVVMLAKNAYVWLDQLSRKYRQTFTRLDQIPDEELDLLAGWGFTGLWLIGVWERSRASARIKQLCGNPEAVASAYSLYDYRIADSLGGEEAFAYFKDRAWKKGIRMAGDMVPNHMGIDSRWVIEHPDWFVSLGHSPFPSYNFGGPDLCGDESVSIHLEEHYFTRTDAAVVFQRTEHTTGDTRYIYHGNDGTSMPWNDTAQLNFLKPEVREAVIQTILHTASRFPIIRFDAAMTLTKKHYQRLWFPEPGTGGDIPSRAEHGMTKQEFDRQMPLEFWREVVDRVAEEAPDTLLLAEAFWLLEGYFVRTLGMHRVYNSAFMNMLKNEENANYRSVIKNTLEFDPQVLKRFVNFMNNPDEETAVAQFGKDDKYIGVCTMMVTMPGLPMFGHGQIEGYTEKYGMEYRRAYWDEQPDLQLVQRHEREVFPLIRRRYLFAEVESFLFYDFFTPEGHVNEDVYVYSNRFRGERALIVYHNRYAKTRGWIRSSVAYSVKKDGERSLIQKNLGEGLGLENGEGKFTILRDFKAGLEYIRRNRDLIEQGLYVELRAYQCHVFLDIQQVEDNEQHRYAQLASFLDGKGVPNMQEAMKELFLKPLHLAWKQLVNPLMIGRIMEARLSDSGGSPDETLLGEVERKLEGIFTEMKTLSHRSREEIQTRAASRPQDENLPHVLAGKVKKRLEVLLQIVILEDRFPSPAAEKVYREILEAPGEFLGEDLFSWGSLLSWLFVHLAGKIAGEGGFALRSRSWLDEWLLAKVTASVLTDTGLEEAAAREAVAVSRILTTHQRWFDTDGEGRNKSYRVMESLLRDLEVQSFLQVNRYQGILWYNAEAFGQLLRWLFTVAIVQLLDGSSPDASVIMEEVFDILGALKRAHEKSDYQVEKLMDVLRK